MYRVRFTKVECLKIFQSCQLGSNRSKGPALDSFVDSHAYEKYGKHTLFRKLSAYFPKLTACEMDCDRVSSAKDHHGNHIYHVQMGQANSDFHPLTYHL